VGKERKPRPEWEETVEGAINRNRRATLCSNQGGKRDITKEKEIENGGPEPGLVDKTVRGAGTKKKKRLTTSPGVRGSTGQTEKVKAKRGGKGLRRR